MADIEQESAPRDVAATELTVEVAGVRWSVPDGDFTLTNVIGERCLRVDGLPVGWRLMDITYEGENYTHRLFSFEQGREVSGVLIRIEPGKRESLSSPTCSR